MQLSEQTSTDLSERVRVRTHVDSVTVANVADWSNRVVGTQQSTTFSLLGIGSKIVVFNKLECTTIVLSQIPISSLNTEEFWGT